MFSTVQTVQPCDGWLYLIHFTEKLHHAGHYLGSSVQLMKRLRDHARGQGSRITQVLWEESKDWELAAIFVPRDPRTQNIRHLERRAKGRHRSTRYCPLCQNGNHISPPGTVQYPTPAVTAQSLRNGNL